MLRRRPNGLEGEVAEEYSHCRRGDGQGASSYPGTHLVTVIRAGAYIDASLSNNGMGESNIIVVEAGGTDTPCFSVDPAGIQATTPPLSIERRSREQ